jgi:proteasome lid subunit RPN8/RPN11
VIYKSKTIDKLIIPRDFREDLAEMADIGSPGEVSALLIGERRQRTFRCADIHFADSRPWQDSSFEMENTWLSKYLDKHGKLREEVIAVFHTHPGGDLTPSFDDIKGMIKTAVPWVIMKPDSERFIAKAYILEEEVVRVIPVTT